MELDGSQKAVLEARKILDHFRQEGQTIVHIQHLSLRPGATFFLPGTDGAEIHPQVQPLPGEKVIQKAFPNSFRNTALLEYLRKEEIGPLVLAGMMTHMCLEATTRAAFDLGFPCTVIHDACATRGLSFGETILSAGQVQAAFLAALGSVYARIVSAGDYLLSLSSEGR